MRFNTYFLLHLMFHWIFTLFVCLDSHVKDVPFQQFGHINSCVFNFLLFYFIKWILFIYSISLNNYFTFIHHEACFFRCNTIQFRWCNSIYVSSHLSLVFQMNWIKYKRISSDTTAFKTVRSLASKSFDHLIQNEFYDV